jgi:Polysaccharide pyruvyl transferase
MKIAHLYPKYHPNVGDHLVQRGILRLLRKHVGDFEYTPIATRYTGPDPNEPTGITAATVDRINQHDLLVIGGSNLYETTGDQWGVEVEKEALRRLTVPVLPLGIGGGWSFAYPLFPVLPTTVVEDLKMIHARALGSSVRDLLTERLLSSYGISSTLTGCPATFLAEDPPRPARKGIVGISFLPRRMYSASTLDPWLRRNSTHRRRRAVTQLFRDLLRRIPGAGYEARILVHATSDLPLARRLVGPDGFFHSEEPERLLEAIAECDVVLGFRLHANIAALGLGIPSIPILLDGRTNAFVETFGMTEHAIPIDPAAVGMTLQRLALAMGEGRRMWNPTFARRDTLRKTMHSFLESALSSSRAAAVRG